MNEQQTSKARRGLQGYDKAMLIAIGVLVLLMIALAVAQGAGLSPVNGQIALVLPALVGMILLVRGAYALFRRVKHRVARLAVGAALGLVLLLALTLVFSYIGFAGAIALPSQYAVVASPSGARRLVVMRVLDPDETRMQARRDARLAADPEADPEMAVEDWGYVYVAYPQVLRFFYRSDADVEGEVHIAYASESALMVEWQDDESAARFFVETPGPGDGGECVVKY